MEARWNNWVISPRLHGFFQFILFERYENTNVRREILKKSWEKSRFHPRPQVLPMNGEDLVPTSTARDDWFMPVFPNIPAEIRRSGDFRGVY